MDVVFRSHKGLNHLLMYICILSILCLKHKNFIEKKHGNKTILLLVQMNLRRMLILIRCSRYLVLVDDRAKWPLNHIYCIWPVLSLLLSQFILFSVQQLLPWLQSDLYITLQVRFLCIGYIGHRECSHTTSENITSKWC